MSLFSRDKSGGSPTAKKGYLWNLIWKENDAKNSRNSAEDISESSNNSPPSPQSPSHKKKSPRSSRALHLNDPTKAESTNIAKAKQVILEIEAIIQKELSMMTDESFTLKGAESSPSPKQRKRRGPKLIRPLNKKKNKMVVGEMEFDPIRNIWIGNERELNVFQRANPALITNMGRNQVQVVGEMVFDPVELKWKGNEKDLSKFKSTNRPALISQLNPVNEVIEKNGMVFDPDEMTWKGNDDEVDIFDGLETEEEKNNFKVGQEFSLSPEMRAYFLECQKRHEAQVGGWFKKDLDRNARSHLNTIRSMSIMRIINQAKHGPVGPLSGSASSKLSASVPTASNSSTMMTDNNGTTIRLKSPAVSSDDEDWGDVEFKPNMKLQSFHVNSANSLPSIEAVESLEDFTEEAEKDVGMTESPRAPIISPRPAHSNPMLSKFQDQEEESDDDLDFDNVQVPAKKTTLKKVASAGKDIARLSLSSDDERFDEEEDMNEWDGLEVPQGSRLSLTSANLGSKEEDEAFWNSGSERSRSNSFNSTHSLTAPVEVVEEDWPDVEIPTNKKLSLRLANASSASNVNKLAHNRNPSVSGNRSEDDLSGIELPSNGSFAFRRNRGISEGEESEKETPKFDDEDWTEGLDLPDDFATKLSKGPASSATNAASSASVLKSNLFA
eukprot:TRINITY_DN3249_c0_g1_i3.p1 TRINITY_DN3249_c0_g1~~TRINITY_DN3249_c0_g1_i3.p1  ORF type:complete len:668 (-),score=169.09 TRINITY_DN3249_c0_g1_i3:46-2049(-)